MNESTETSYDIVLNQYNDIKEDITRKLDLISIHVDKNTILYVPIEKVSIDNFKKLLRTTTILLIKKIVTKEATVSKILDRSFARILDDYSPCLRYLEEYDNKIQLCYIQVDIAEFLSLLNESVSEVDLRQLLEAINTEATKRASLMSKTL